MKITEYFERTYVINLPQRVDRRQMITQELAKAGMPLTPNQVEIFPAIRPQEAGEFPNIGAKGCFLSHLEILKRARQEGLANVLVIEDDLGISELFTLQQQAIIDQLRQQNWGLVYFGHILNLESQTSSTITLQPYDQPILTTHFYAVNGWLFDRLIEFLEQLQQRPAGHPDGGPMFPDGAYNTFREQNPDVLTLVASPNLGWQQSSPSDITPKWFDRVPFVRPLVSAARTYLSF